MLLAVERTEPLRKVGTKQINSRANRGRKDARPGRGGPGRANGPGRGNTRYAWPFASLTAVLREGRTGPARSCGLRMISAR